MLIGLQRKSA